MAKAWWFVRARRSQLRRRSPRTGQSAELSSHRAIRPVSNTPILFHGLSQLGLPVVCVESRQAYQALKSLATHKTDRNDARGLAHWTCPAFVESVFDSTLPALRTEAG